MVVAEGEMRTSAKWWKIEKERAERTYKDGWPNRAPRSGTFCEGCSDARCRLQYAVMRSAERLQEGVLPNEELCAAEEVSVKGTAKLVENEVVTENL